MVSTVLFFLDLHNGIHCFYFFYFFIYLTFLLKQEPFGLDYLVNKAVLALSLQDREYILKQKPYIFPQGRVDYMDYITITLYQCQPKDR